jgi:hypothetical protein
MNLLSRSMFDAPHRCPATWWVVVAKSVALASLAGLLWAGFLSSAPAAGVPESLATNKPPRAARSVHWGWTAPAGEAFYNEMVVEQSVPGSYFMAAGWNTGYFGIQELNAPTNKVVLFSVWDPTRGDNPNAVPDEQQVELLHSDPDVRIKRFGGEGTGGQCMWKHLWQVGETNRFCLRASVDGEKTAYAAYYYLNDQRRWKHLATFRTRTKGSSLKGYYSFVEDFRRDYKSVHEVRRARFANGWVKAPGGDWAPLTQARFTASSAAWEAKENINAGITETGFYLVTGGNTTNTLKLRETLTRPGSGLPPKDLP